MVRVILISHRRSSHTAAAYSRFDRPSYFDLISTPLASICRTQQTQRGTVVLYCKDNRVVRIDTSSDKAAAQMVVAIQQAAFLAPSSSSQGRVASSLLRENLFAFRYRAKFKSDGWKYSDVRFEYVRMGLATASDWTVCRLIT